MAATYQEIQAQIRDLTAAAEAARKAELDQALSQIRDLIQQCDLTEDDLKGLVTKRRGRSAATSTASASKGVPKYRDPKTGRTWTGQGKPPNWIKDARDRNVYLIEEAAQATVKKGGRGSAKRAAPAKRVGRKKAAVA